MNEVNELVEVRQWYALELCSSIVTRPRLLGLVVVRNLTTGG